MLLRHEHVMTEEQSKVALRHLQNAICVRSSLPLGIPLENDRVWLPSCHGFAHAYGKVFDLRVTDGEVAYLTGSKLVPATWRRQESIDLQWGFIKHSWIEFDAGGAVFILDILPEGTVLPVLLPYPHPGYYVPVEAKHREVIEKKMGDGDYKKEVEVLSGMIEQIAKENRLK